MQRTETGTRRDSQRMRLRTGCCLLLLFVLTSTPVAPVFTGFLGALDPNHHVLIRQTAHGLQVVLRHDCFHLPSHHHGLIARALTAFARPATARNPDHVIQFGSTENVQRTPAMAITPALQAQVVDGVPVSVAWFAAPRTASFPAAFPRPPPRAGEFALTLRSTVLIL